MIWFVLFVLFLFAYPPMAWFILILGIAFMVFGGGKK